MRPFNYIKPTTKDKALSQKQADSQYIAGGTNLIDLMKKDIVRPDKVVDITAVLQDTIQPMPAGILISALAKNSAVADHKLIVSTYPLLSKAINAGASPQIRHMASVGGNLLQKTRCPYFYDVTLPCNKRQSGSGCSAINGIQRMSAIVGWSDQCVAVFPSDMSVALAALDATVHVTDKKGVSSKIAFKDFHRLPGDTPHIDNNLPGDSLITGIEIHQNPFAKHHAYLKIRDRDSYAFALVSVAACLEIKNNVIVQARLASGGVAHKPWRWYDAENYLKGKAPVLKEFQEAAQIATDSVKPLANNGFKSLMLNGAIQTALQQCMNKG